MKRWDSALEAYTWMPREGNQGAVVEAKIGSNYRDSWKAEIWSPVFWAQGGKTFTATKRESVWHIWGWSGHLRKRWARGIIRTKVGHPLGFIRRVFNIYLRSRQVRTIFIKLSCLCFRRRETFWELEMDMQRKKWKHTYFLSKSAVWLVAKLAWSVS